YKDAMAAFKELLKLPIQVKPENQELNTILTQSRIRIGTMYMEGQGTEINLAEAANYLTLAFRNFYTDQDLKIELSERLEIIKKELQKILANLEII
ncbi:MAG: hypothetical protein P4L22_02620, partial [Candidatus Babeliales bacterium]|nr:hypothetical protein [Candidatus Babeliales bacterium]